MDNIKIEGFLGLLETLPDMLLDCPVEDLDGFCRYLEEVHDIVLDTEKDKIVVFDNVFFRVFDECDKKDNIELFDAFQDRGEKIIEQYNLQHALMGSEGIIIDYLFSEYCPEEILDNIIELMMGEMP